MKLYLENIGKIKDCSIELKGITTIAGINNSGKSTIGKALYSIYHTFHDISDKVFISRTRAISRALRELDFFYLPNEKIEKEFVTSAKSKTVEDIEQMLLDYRIQDGQTLKTDSVNTREIAQKIFDTVNLSDEGVMELILKRNISQELGCLIGNVNHPEKKSAIKIQIKDDIVSDISFAPTIKINKYINYVKDIIYIDDPFVLDSIQSYRNIFFSMNGHKRNLVSLLVSENDQDLIGQYITEQKLETITRELSKVCEGKLINKQGRWVYHSDKFKEDLDICSLSAGLKNFVVIRTLFEKGAITNNGIVIMDEPEINLHPAWQLILAEILVLLHKDFGLNILLNTHSPYFLNAIESYSKKHEITKDCKYYMTRNKGDWASVEDVTNDIDCIYKLLAEPLQVLEDVANE